MKPCVECMEANGKYLCSQQGCCPLEGIVVLIRSKNGTDEGGLFGSLGAPRLLPNPI